MRNEIINIKTDRETKKKAKYLAAKLGFSLSAILNAYMREFIKTKTIIFSAETEEPSDWLTDSLKESERDIRAGRVSPPFDNAEDAIAWLKNPRARYQNQIKWK